MILQRTAADSIEEWDLLCCVPANEDYGQGDRADIQHRREQERDVKGTTFFLLRAPFGQYGPVAATWALSVYRSRLAPWTRGESNHGKLSVLRPLGHGRYRFATASAEMSEELPRQSPSLLSKCPMSTGWQISSKKKQTCSRNLRWEGSPIRTRSGKAPLNSFMENISPKGKSTAASSAPKKQRTTGAPASVAHPVPKPLPTAHGGKAMAVDARGGALQSSATPFPWPFTQSPGTSSTPAAPTQHDPPSVPAPATKPAVQQDEPASGPTQKGVQEQPSVENPAVECKNWWFFASFFWPGAPLSGKTRVKCQKLRVFCVFCVPESVLRIVLTIPFATHGLFFERAKISENRQKTLKTEGFLRFFHVRSDPLWESGCRVLKTKGFLRFWCA